MFNFIIKFFGGQSAASHNAACLRESNRHLGNAERYMRHGMLYETIRSVGLANAWRDKVK